MAQWQQTLDSFFVDPGQTQKETKLSPFEKFVAEVALPAFEELRPAFEKHGRRVSIRSTPSSAVITVFDGTSEEIMFRMQERTLPDRRLPYAQVRMRERGGLRLVTVEAMLLPGASDYYTEDITKDDVIQCVLQHYMSRIKLQR
ncbi:MAG: hypothetical protein ACNA71_02575 [Kiritimatiellia bacterium]